MELLYSSETGYEHESLIAERVKISARKIYGDVDHKKTSIDKDTFSIVFSGKRKKLTSYKLISEYIFIEYKDNETVAEYPSKVSAKLISMVKDGYIDKGKEKEFAVIEEVNKWTADNVLWWLRTTFVDGHTKKIVVKPRKRSNEYKLVMKSNAENVLDVLLSLETIKGDENLLSKVKEVFAKKFSNGEMSFAYRYLKKDSDGNTYQGVPSLLLWLNDNWTDILLSEYLIVKEIKLLSNDPNEHAYSHVSLEKLNKRAGEETPTIDSWTNSVFRDDQIAVLRAYMYGVFLDDFHTRQGLYIEDLIGKTGKSTFLNAYLKYFTVLAYGKYASMNTKNFSKEFAYSQFLGKILAVDQDVKNEKLLMTEVYHKITGGDNCSVESKGVDPFTARIKCCVIMSGNIQVHVNTSFEHETSRIIYLKMGRIKEDYLKDMAILNEDGTVHRNTLGSHRFKESSSFVKKLEEEMGAWIANSKLFYDELSGGSEVLLNDAIWGDLMANAASSDSEIIEDFIDTNIEFTPLGVCKKSDLKRRFSSVNTQSNSFTFSELVKILEVKHNMLSMSRKNNGTSYRGYKGLKLVDLNDNSSFGEPQIKEEEF